MRKRIYIMGAFLISLCLLSFSCAFNIIPEDQGNGSVSFYLPTSREVRGNENKEQNIEQPLEYTVSIKSEDGKYNFENKYLEGDTVKVDKLAENTYLISATAEDDKYTYSGKAKQVIKARESVSVTLDITQTLKGGYIDLSFGNIKFDENATINVVVKDAEDKECFNKKDIPVKEFNDNKYSLPYIFKQGEYKVLVAGGNTDKEVYVVEQGTLIPVVRGVVSLCTVEAIPYHAIYVKASSQAEEKGTESNPFKTITKALEYVNTINIPAKIVIDGEQAITSPLLITQDMSVQLCGQNNASILSNSSEVISNQGNLVLYNIEISNSASKASVVYESGNLVLENDVYIDSISLAQDMKLQINKPLKLSSEKNMSIFIPTYTEGIKVFNFKLGVGINTDFIKLESADFRINGKGELERIVKPLTITPTNFTNCKNITYRVLSMDNQEIIPLTKLETVDVMNPNALVPNLKAGLQYTIELYADSINGNAPDKSGLQNNVEAYRKVWYQNITIDALNDNKVDFDLSSNGAFSTGSLYISSKSTDIKGYPLTLTLVGNNGYKTTQTLFGIPTYINYLPEGTYRVSLTGESIKEGYELTSDTINIVNGKTSLEGEFRPIPKSIYYVSNVGKEGATGSSSDPFVSLNVAFTKLENSTTPITLIIKDNISVTTPILISTPLDVTIIGNNPTAKPQISGSADIEILSLNNPNCNVTFRKLAIKSNGGVFNNIDGILNLEDGVELLSDTPNTKAISVSSNGVLNLKGNINLSNTYIELKDNRKINVVGLLTSPTPLKVSVVAPYNGREVFDFANENLENLVSTNFAYFDDTYKFDYETKKLLESDIFNFNDTRNQLLAPPSSSLSIRTYLDNEYELHEVGKLLRGLPNNQRVSLDLKVNKNINTLDSTVFNPLLNGIDTLESITIPDSIIYIDENTFAYSPNLTTVNFGQGYTWAYESDINTINPSENPTLVADNLKLKDCAFGRVVQLVDIKSILSDPTMSGNKGFIVDSSEKNLTELSNLIKNYKGGNIVLDLHLTSITDIPANCFSDCKKLTKVVLPASLTSIGANAFSGCDNLVSVVFPELSTWTIGSEDYVPYFEKAKLIENARALKASTSTWTKNNIINLYVDGSLGDDELNNGTASNKFKTVSKAVSLLNRNSSSTINSDVIIHVNGTVQENKEIFIEKECNLTIKGDNSVATIQGKKGLLGKSVLSIGYSIPTEQDSIVIKPNVTLENIKITGASADNTVNSDEVGNAINLYFGSLTLGNGVVITGNGNDDYPEDYSNAVFVDYGADSITLKGNATVGESTGLNRNAICLSRRKGVLIPITVSKGFTGFANVIGNFKSNDQVINGEASSFGLFNIPDSLIDTYDSKTGKVILKDVNVATLNKYIYEKESENPQAGMFEVKVCVDGSAGNTLNDLYQAIKTKTIAFLDLSSSTSITQIPLTNEGYDLSRFDYTGVSGSGFIQEIVLPPTLISIGANAFKNTGISHTVIIPESVTSIGANAFLNCSAKLKLQKGSAWQKGQQSFSVNDEPFAPFVEEIKRIPSPEEIAQKIKDNPSGELAVSFNATCDTDFTDILKPALQATKGTVALTVFSSSGEIPRNAFENCASLTSVVIDKNIKVIHKNAFTNCTGLKSASINNTEVWHLADNTTFNPVDVTGAPSSAVAVLTKGITMHQELTPIQLESYVNLLLTDNIVNEQTFVIRLMGTSDDSNVNNIIKKITNNVSLEVEAPLSRAGTDFYFDNFIFDADNLVSIKLPYNTTVIGKNTFANCINLSSVDFSIPEGQYIAWVLSEVTNPNANSNVTVFTGGNDLVANANALKEKLTAEKYWLKACTKYNVLDFIKENCYFEQNLLYYAENTIDIDTLRTSLKWLESEECTRKNYVNLKLYTTMQNIPLNFSTGMNDMVWCTENTKQNGIDYLKSVEILSPGKTIMETAFINCANLEKVHFPKEYVVNGGAFASCERLYEVTGADSKLLREKGLVVFGNEINSYTDSDKSTIVTIPNNISSIASHAFNECNNVTEIRATEKLHSIGAYAFRNCINLSNFKLPTVPEYTDVSNGLFLNCTSMNTLTIPTNVSTLGELMLKYVIKDSNSGNFSLVMEDVNSKWAAGNDGYNEKFNMTPDLLYVPNTDSGARIFVKQSVQ